MARSRVTADIIRGLVAAHLWVGVAVLGINATAATCQRSLRLPHAGHALVGVLRGRTIRGVSIARITNWLCLVWQTVPDRVDRVVRHVLVSNVHLRVVVAQVSVVLTRRQ
jgi:hypothetical protein